jgi:hypothetical protein
VDLTNTFIPTPQNCCCACLLAAHCTSNHCIAEMFLLRVVSVNFEPVFVHCELNTHADTCALGRNFTPLSFTGRICDVSPYSSEHYESEKNVPIITGATAYTCQESGQTYILVINEGLWLGPKMSHSLLNPNQMRYNGVTVHDNPFDSHNPLSVEHDEANLPLSISGTNIFLDTRTPTQHEPDNCPHLHLTSEAEWNPQTVHLASTQSVEAEVIDNHDELDPGLLQISSVYCFLEMAENLRSLSAVQTDLPGYKAFISKQWHSVVTPEQLSKQWDIGLSQAKQTIKVTTQRGVRSVILPLSRRYRTDQMYNQKRLRGQHFYTDTLIGKYNSLTNNTCAQIFANESFFAKAYLNGRCGFEAVYS